MITPRFRNLLSAAVFCTANFFQTAGAQLDYSQPTSVTTLSGTGLPINGSNDGAISEARLNGPADVEINSAGDFYIADRLNHKIRKVSGDTMSTVAGSGVAGDADGTGAAASFSGPGGLALDGSGNIYVADTGNHKIRKISPAGVVTTLAGSGFAGSADGTGANASFDHPQEVAVDSGGNVFVADSGNHKIRKISPLGEVSTYAGSGLAGSENGLRLSASFRNPSGLWVDAAGGVYIADTDNHLIRKIGANGVVSTLAGSTQGNLDGAALSAQFNHPRSLRVTENGTIYIADTDNHKIRSISSGYVDTVAGSGTAGGNDSVYPYNQAPVTFHNPTGISVGPNGEILVADSLNHRIRKISGTSTSTVAGIDSARNGPGVSAQFAEPMGVHITVSFKNIIVADTANNKIRKVAPDGTTTSVTNIYTETAGLTLNAPQDVITDPPGNYYIADTGSRRILKFSQGATNLGLLAGSGEEGDADGTKASASFRKPVAVALDAGLNVFVVDAVANKIRKITQAGVVTTFAGSGAAGSADGTGGSASFSNPTGIAIDSSNNVYIADQGNHKIRKITASGVVTTVAGSGIAGAKDGSALNAQFNGPIDVAVDGSSNLYVTDAGGTLIRKISASGAVTTLAGGGAAGADGVGAAAGLSAYGITSDSAGLVHFADRGNNRIRRLNGTLPQTINFPQPADRALGASNLSATSDSGLPISFTVISGPAIISTGSSLIQIIGQGTVVVRATQVGNSVYQAAIPVERSFEAKTSQSISFATIFQQSMNSPLLQLNAYASSGLPVSYSVTGPATVSGSTVTLTGGGTVTVIASQAGDATYAPAADVSRSFSVSKKSQSITFPAIADQPSTNSSVALNASASSGLPITYSVSSGPAVVSGSSLQFTGGTGAVTVTANQAGDNVHNAATPVTIVFTIFTNSQTITFPTIATQSLASPTVTLNATASSGLAVTYLVTAGPATVSGTTLTLTGAGSVTVRADQGGNANFEAAASVSRTFTVSKISQTITFPVISGSTLETTQITLAATASSGLPVSYSVISGPAIVSGSQLNLTGAGTVTVRASQAGDATYNAATAIDRSFTVSKIAQLISFLPIASQKVPNVLTLSASASSGLPVTYSVISGPAILGANSTVTFTGVGTVEISASQAGDSTYLAATSVTQTFTILKESQTISFPEIGDRILSNRTVTLAATSSSDLTVTYTVSGPATISGATLTLTGEGTVSVTASQAGNASYTAATPVVRTFTATKAAQAIIFNPLANRLLTSPSFTLSATASSTLAVTYTVTGPATVSGSTLTVTGEGTVTVKATQAGNGFYTAAPAIEQSFTSSKAPQTIAFSALPDRSFVATNIALSASSSVGLTVAFTVVSGPATITGSTLKLTGTGEVSIRASQAGSTIYAAATPIIQNFTVTPNSALQLSVSNYYGGVIPDGSTWNLGGIPFGETSAYQFVIQNNTTRAANLDYRITGAHASDFILIDPPATVGASSSVILTVRATPGDLGARNAVLRISDPALDANPFDFNLAGTGVISAAFTDATVETHSPRSIVTAAFRITNPDGRALDLPKSIIERPGFFQITEDGMEPGGETHIQIGKSTDIPMVIKTVLLIDNSLSMSTRLAVTKSAAKSMIDAAVGNQQFAIYSFSETSLKLQGFTSDKTALRAAIDAIPTIDLLPSRDLYGAIIQGLGEWTDSANLSGGVRGSLVVLTGGTHTSGGTTQEQVLTARGSKRIFTIGLGSSMDGSSLYDIGNGGFFYAPTTAELASLFAESQSRILADEKSSYWVSYISPKRGNQDHTLEIRMPGNINGSENSVYRATFNSNGFTSEQSGVVINRDITNPRGVSAIAISSSAPSAAQAFTILPADPDNSPAYTWSVENPAIAKIIAQGSKITIVPLASGSTHLTVTDTVNQPYGSFYRKTIDLTVANVAGTSFGNWALLAGLSQADALPAATPWQDGISNLLKYAFNLNGSGPDVRMMTSGALLGLPLVTVDSAAGQPALRVEFLRRKNSGLTYAAERSGNLDSFIPLIGVQTVTAIDPAWERVVIVETNPPSAASGAFARVRVSAP